MIAALLSGVFPGLDPVQSDAGDEADRLVHTACGWGQHLGRRWLRLQGPAGHVSMAACVFRSFLVLPVGEPFGVLLRDHGRRPPALFQGLFSCSAVYSDRTSLNLQ